MAFQEKIGTLTKTSDTTVQLTGNSIIKLGGQQRSLSSPSLDTSVSGIGGLDTGAIAASSFYYVYAVYNGSAVGIVASLSATSPSGFTRYKKVGAIVTNQSSLISIAYSSGKITITDSIKVSAPSAWGSSYSTTPRFGSIDEENSRGLLKHTNDAANGSIFTVLKDCVVSAVFNHCGQTLVNSALDVSISRNGTNTTVQAIKSDMFGGTRHGSSTNSTTPFVTVGGSLYCIAGDIIRCHVGVQVMSYGAIYSNFSISAVATEDLT
jgi:hypothetical protein